MSIAEVMVYMSYLAIALISIAVALSVLNWLSKRK